MFKNSLSATPLIAAPQNAIPLNAAIYTQIWMQFHWMQLHWAINNSLGWTRSMKLKNVLLLRLKKETDEQ